MRWSLQRSGRSKLKKGRAKCTFELCDDERKKKEEGAEVPFIFPGTALVAGASE